MTLYELYGPQSEEFIQGVLAALEYFASDTSRLQLRLYGKPLTREVVQLEKQAILDDFTQKEEEIKL
jgi:hypothetical protein